MQRELLDKFDVERVRDNAKDRVIELTNGSMIRIASVSRADSAVGRSYDLIIFDEAALNDYGGTVFNINLRPTLDKDESKCIFISTPRGDNWFREFYDRGYSEDPLHADWISIHADYRENPRASDRDIAAARSTMSNAEFEQEYLANFVTFEGQIWELRDSQIQDLTHFKNAVLEGSKPVEMIAGLDLGFRDYTALAVIAVEEVNGQNVYYIVEEYFARKRSTEEHAKAISELQTKWGIDFIYCDPAAAQTRFDLVAMYDIATMNAKKDVAAGIGAVAAIIENDRLVVEETCFEVVYAMRNYKWAGEEKGGMYTLEREKPLHNRASHMSDSIRYAIYTYEQGIGGAF